MQLLDKLLDLKNNWTARRADDVSIMAIDSWFERAKQLFILKSLKDNDGMKYVLEIYQGEINKINEQLLKADSKILPDDIRDRLLDKRDMYQKHLNLFNTVESELEDIENKVEENY